MQVGSIVEAGLTLAICFSDAFRPYATELFILQMMVKNFLFYAFSTFVNDFAAGPGGAAHMCQVWGIVTVCGFATCVPMCKEMSLITMWQVTN